MRQFLLDTNIWAYLYSPERYPSQYASIKKHIDKGAVNVRLGISVISWGEIAVGMPGDNSKQRAHLQFIRSNKPWILGIDFHTAEQYGRLRGCLNLERDKSGGIARDRFTWLELGSRENDLWIVAQAISRNLTLVTNDKNSMRPLIDVAGDELHVENWAE